jgi:hypothetical protein
MNTTYNTHRKGVMNAYLIMDRSGNIMEATTSHAHATNVAERYGYNVRAITQDTYEAITTRRAISAWTVR